MTPKTVSLLNDPEPHSHFVYPSSDECLISEAVATFAGAGLRKGEAVILVTTETRRAFIERRLEAGDHKIALLEQNGQLAFLEAGKLMSAFLEAGMPDAERFKYAVGAIVEKASVDPATGKTRKIRIFGEMVSLLYRSSNLPAAERLEEFWNEMVAAHAISLFCAYSLPADTRTLPQTLLDSHSHDVAAFERPQ
jgi:hypothetical protein